MEAVLCGATGSISYATRGPGDNFVEAAEAEKPREVEKNPSNGR